MSIAGSKRFNGIEKLIPRTLTITRFVLRAKMTTGQNEFVLITHGGMSIRFNEEDARPMGRAAVGVYGIDLETGDRVVALAIVDPNATLLVAGENGIGKRTDEIMMITTGGQMVRTAVAPIREAGRNTMGVKLVDLTEGDKLQAIAPVIGEESQDAAGGEAPSPPPPPAPTPPA